MPRGDRTGPEGYGSMTGRGAGFCAGYQVPGFQNAAGTYGRGGGFGRRAGRGFGGGFGRRGGGYGRQWASAPVMPVQQPVQYDAPASTSELEYLKQQQQYLQQELESLNRRIADIDTTEE